MPSTHFAPLPSAPHLIVPFASAGSAGCMQALDRLQLQHLPALLQGLCKQPLRQGDAWSYSAPHEHALAHALGWPETSIADGTLAWAAHLAQQHHLPHAAEGAWGLLTLCHWQIGADAVHMAPPSDLDVSPDEADQLVAAMQPWFAEDGLTLHPLPPHPDRPGTHWLVHGPMLAGLRTASLDRVSGRNVDRWMALPAHADGASALSAPLRRLQSEMQMLLYTHPVNETRAARHALPVNSFWISGTGMLPPDTGPAAAPATVPATTPHVLRHLTHAALAEDWPAWLADWQHLDATVFAPLLQQHRAQPQQALSITLCGESHAQCWQSGKASWRDKLRRHLHPLSLSATLKALSPCA